MWSDFVGKPFSRDELAAYINGLTWTKWRPVGIILHNTAAPTLAQWAESGSKLAARIRNLQHYYESQQGWRAGPHFFVGRSNIVVFSNLLRGGVHSPSFNATHFGIEMVGDFSKEEFNSGDGALVRDNSVFVMALLCRKFGWDPARVIKLHKEDPRTTHACPGKNVVKSDVVARVKDEMNRLSAPAQPELPLEPGHIPTPAPAPATVPIPPPVLTSSRPDLRLVHAKNILDLEARKDLRGRLKVYQLPANDGGGRYEVAGINERYNGPMVLRLVALIDAGKHQQAEQEAIEYIAKDTDVAMNWYPHPAVESYLRDTVFNRGRTGAMRILQRAVGVPDDGRIGPVTEAAIAKQAPAELLKKLRQAREQYERVVVGYRPNFWKGLTNRWNNAYKTAEEFLEEAYLAQLLTE